MNDYAPLLLVLLALTEEQVAGAMYIHCSRGGDPNDVTGPDVPQLYLDYVKTIRPYDWKGVQAGPYSYVDDLVDPEDWRLPEVADDDVKDWIENDPLAKELQALHRSKVMAVSNFRQEEGIIKFDVEVAHVPKDQLVKFEGTMDDKLDLASFGIDGAIDEEDDDDG